MGEFDWAKKGRYIFFRDLYNKQQYAELYAIGEERISATGIDSLEKSKELKSDNETDFYNKIISYLNMLEKIYTNMIKSEGEFFSGNLPLLESSQLFPQINVIIIKMQNGQPITEDEYRQIIAVTNYLSNPRDLDTIKRNLENALNNITILSRNFETQLTADEKQQARQDWLAGAYDKQSTYINKLTQQLEQEDKTTKKIIQTQSQVYSSRVNRALSKLATSKKFIDFISEKYGSSNKRTTILTGEELKNLIIAIIYEEVNRGGLQQVSNTTINQIIERIKTNFSEDSPYLSEINQQYARVFKGKSSNASQNQDRSIEQIIEQNNGNIAQILEMCKNSEKIIRLLAQKYGGKQKQLLNLWNELLTALNDHNSTARTISNRRRAFNNEIKKLMVDHKLKIPKKAITIPPMASIFDDILPEFALGCKLTLSKSDMSELLSQGLLKEGPRLISSKVPGNKINLKDDVHFILELPHKSINTELELKYEKELYEIETYIKQTLGQFLERQYAKVKSATDIGEAQKTYFNLLKELYDKIQAKIKQIGMSQQEQELIIQKLQKTFVGGISVKDYSTYNNELGFHGGSLGTSGKPLGVIANIESMYEAGGITPIDTEKLIFAILNCSPSAIGSNLQTSLENYLLGGAALIMFDEGFAYGKKWLEDASMAFQQFVPKNLTLYYLNQTYIPGSYILYNIIQNLKNFYSILPQNQSTIIQRNRVVISNSASTQDIQKGDNLQDTFALTGEYILNNKIKISYLFMAGMLDILEDLTKIFNVK